MLLDSEDIFEPHERENRAQRAHEPEAASPAHGVNEPAEDGREDGQREILRRIEDCRRAPALHGGKPCGHDAPVTGKHRRLGKAGKQPEDEDGGKCEARPKIARKGGEESEERPQDDADSVDPLRPEAIEQSSRRQLPQHISPTESGEEVAEPDRRQVDRLLHGRSGQRQGHAIAVAEAAYGEDDGDNQIPYSGFSRI